MRPIDFNHGLSPIARPFSLFVGSMKVIGILPQDFGLDLSYALKLILPNSVS